MKMALSYVKKSIDKKETRHCQFLDALGPVGTGWEPCMPFSSLLVAFAILVVPCQTPGYLFGQGLAETATSF